MKEKKWEKRNDSNQILSSDSLFFPFHEILTKKLQEKLELSLLSCSTLVKTETGSLSIILFHNASAADLVGDWA